MTRILIVSSIFIVALTVLVWVGVIEASIPVLKLSRLATEYSGGVVRVDDGKVARIESLAPLKFTVTVENDPDCLVAVESNIPPPENFKEGGKVGLTGDYSRDRKVFKATKIMTQCPSRYEAAKEAVGSKPVSTEDAYSTPRTPKPPVE